MNSHQTSEPLQISNNDKKNENKQMINNIIPQSTKHAGHSKIKGFSFQLENNPQLSGNRDKLNKEDNLKERFQIIEEESSKNPNKYHKNKISLSSTPSHLLNNKDNTNKFSKQDEKAEKTSLVNNANNNSNNSNSNRNYNNTGKDYNISNKNSQLQEKNNLNGNPKVSIDTPLNITDLIKDQNYLPLDKGDLKKPFEKYEPARHSGKSLSVVKSFAANTHQGTVRKYNEDRVSIILNIVKPSTFKGSYWPTCSFFAVFDGHGGSKCADFLKDNLHNYVSLLYNITNLLLLLF